MISLIVRLDVVPDRREEFLEAITSNAASTFGDEPGCLRFDVCQDRYDPHHFVFYEIYRDEAALEAHRAAPHFARWREAVARTVVPGSQVNAITDLVIAHRETDKQHGGSA
ncbi:MULTISPECIES: putative quinol monooxygenase [unclassified Knoellia]|uniref:putative quinol monooxygenase n=1 Tax=Knoellia altitudinis TaxID=3404795 RepID=UPI00360AAC2B